MPWMRTPLVRYRIWSKPLRPIPPLVRAIGFGMLASLAMLAPAQSNSENEKVIQTLRARYARVTLLSLCGFTGI